VGEKAAQSRARWSSTNKRELNTPRRKNLVQGGGKGRRAEEQRRFRMEAANVAKPERQRKKKERVKGLSQWKKERGPL